MAQRSLNGDTCRQCCGIGRDKAAEQVCRKAIRWLGLTRFADAEECGLSGERGQCSEIARRAVHERAVNYDHRRALRVERGQGW